MLYIGPSDLGLSIGREGRMDQTDPVVVAAIDRILKTAKDAGLKAGIYCIDPAYSRAMLAKGFDLVTVLSDTTLIYCRRKHPQTVRLNIVQNIERTSAPKRHTQHISTWRR